jgi:hypothetical protein
MIYDPAGSRGVMDFAAVLAQNWWYFVMPMVFHGLIKGGGPDEDGGWLTWAAKKIGMGVLSGVPVERDIASAAPTGRDYKRTPAISIIEAGKKTYKDLENLTQGKDISPQWLRHSIEAAGYVFGLPIGQAGQSLQYLRDVKEFMHDLVFGAPPKKP